MMNFSEARRDVIVEPGAARVDGVLHLYFASRLPGEPLEGVEDIHLHPVIPRTVRVRMIVGF
jgi:hypothetical protein